MKTPVLAAAFLSFVSLAYSALNTRTGAVSGQVVAIDGIGSPEIVSWSGGEPTASIVLIRGQGLEAPRKTLGPVTYEPIVLEAAPPFSPALQTCFSEFLSGAQTKKTLLLSNIDGSGQSVGETIQANSALLTEIQFPALDASTRTSLRAKFIFRAESTAISATPAPIAGGGNSRNAATSSNFSLTVTGLSASGVSKIDAFTIRREPVTHSSGGVTRLTTGPITIPDLTLTLGGSDIPAWQAWRDAFFPNFSGPPAQTLSAVPYKDGTLQLLSADMRTSLFTLQLSRLGLKRLAQQPIEPGTVLKLRAELFCESMSTYTGNGPAPIAVTANPPPTTKIVPREIDATKTLATKTVAVPAVATAANAEDKGARDPTDFPRPPDVVRTSFTSSRDPALVREIAYYSAPKKASDVITFYEKALESDGWKETSRNEDNAGPGHTFRITSNWTKEKRTALLVLGDIAPDKIEIYVNLQERK